MQFMPQNKEQYPKSRICLLVQKMQGRGIPEMKQSDKLAVVGIALALSFLGFFVRFIWPIWIQAHF